MLKFWSIGIAASLLLVSIVNGTPVSDDAATFQVDFPGEPTFQRVATTINSWEVRLSSGEYFEFSYTDFANDLPREGLDNAIKAASAGQYGALVRVADLDYGGVPGREYLIYGGNPIVMKRRRSFLVGRRLYRIGYHGSLGSEYNLETDTFLNSFQLRKQAGAQVIVMPRPIAPSDVVMSGHVLKCGDNESGCLKLGTVFKDCTDCPDMMMVPSGTFRMGASPKDRGANDSEKPQHNVRIQQAFAIGRFAISRGEYAAFIKESGYKMQGGCISWNGNTAGDWGLRPDRSWQDPGYVQDDTHPVTCVSWYDAKAFASWLSIKTGKDYRLPTEAEREYATRAGTTTAYWWGSSYSNDGESPANYYGYAKWRMQTVSVNSFKPNPWGLYNVHGNVWEWVEDCKSEDYRGAPTDGSAWLVVDCKRRARRGGDWHSSGVGMTSSYRGGWSAATRDFVGGFRVARNLSR